jgi:hypothetical protein
MAWRPTHCLIEGELDNTQPGVVAGWMQFAGIEDKVMLRLQGNFHRDIQGAKIRFRGDGKTDTAEAADYMKGFSVFQNGKVDIITAGLSLFDSWDRPHIEWHSNENGRIVIELEEDQVEVIGEPVPGKESLPISPRDQGKTLGEFMRDVARRAGVPEQKKRTG